MRRVAAASTLIEDISDSVFRGVLCNTVLMKMIIKTRFPPENSRQPVTCEGEAETQNRLKSLSASRAIF